MRRLLPFLVAFATLAAACGPIANKGGVYPRYGGRSSALMGGGYLPGSGSTSGGSGITDVTGDGVAHKAITAIDNTGAATVGYFVDTAGNGISVSNNTATAVAQANKGITVGASGIALDTTNANSTARITYDGTNPKWVNSLQQQSAREMCWWDELDVGQGAQSTHLSATTISSGSLTVASGSDLHPGVWTYSTASNAAGGGRVYTIETGYALSATDITTVKWIVSLRTLDDGTDTYQAWVGTGDNGSTANPVDGFGFVYAKTTAPPGGTTSTKWQIYTVQNSNRTYATLDGSTADTVDSTVAVGDMSANSGQIYSLMVSGTTSRLDFCINDTDDDGYCHAGSTGHVGSACVSGCSMSNANIPAAGTARLWGLKAEIVKTGATNTARIMDIDGAGICRPFSAAR